MYGFSSNMRSKLVGLRRIILVFICIFYATRTHAYTYESSIITQLGGSLCEIRDTWGVSQEAMAGIVPESWLEWGLGAEGDQAPRTPEADILAAYDAVTTNSTKAQRQLASWSTRAGMLPTHPC